MPHIHDVNIPMHSLSLLPLEPQKHIFKYLFTFSYCRDTQLYKILDGLQHNDAFKSLLRSYVKVVTIYMSDSGYVSSNLDSDILAHYSDLFQCYPNISTLVIKPHAAKFSTDIVANHPSLVYFIATKVQFIEILDLDAVDLYGKRIFGPKITRVVYRYHKDLLFLSELVSMRNLKVLNLVVDDPAVTNLKAFSKWLFNTQRYNPKVQKLILSISPHAKQMITSGRDVFSSFISIYHKYKQLLDDKRSSLMVELQYMYLTSLKESVCDIIRECRCHTLDIAFDARSRNIYSDIKLLNRLSELVSLRISSWGVPVRAQKVVLRGTKLRSLVIRHSSSFISCDFSHLFGLESLKLAHCTYEEPVVYPENLKALKLAHSVVRINVNSIPSSLSKLSLSNISNASPIVVDFNSASELKEFTASTCVSLVIQRLPSSLTVLALSSIKCLVIKNDYFLSDCHQITSLLLNDLCASVINRVVRLGQWPRKLKVLSIQCVDALEICGLPTSLTSLVLVTSPGYRKLYIYIGYSKKQVEKHSGELQDYHVKSDHTDCATVFLCNISGCLCDISLRYMTSGSNPNHVIPNVYAIVNHCFEDRSFTIFQQTDETIFLRPTKRLKINTN